MEAKKPIRLSREQWQERIALQRESGLSIAAYCQEFKLTQSNFYAWRKRFSEPKPVQSSKANAFIQLKPKDILSKQVRITTPEGYCLELESSTPPAFIRNLLSLLHA